MSDSKKLSKKEMKAVRGGYKMLESSSDGAVVCVYDGTGKLYKQCISTTSGTLVATQTNQTCDRTISYSDYNKAGGC